MSNFTDATVNHAPRRGGGGGGGGGRGGGGGGGAVNVIRRNIIAVQVDIHPQ